MGIRSKLKVFTKWRQITILIRRYCEAFNIFVIFQIKEDAQKLWSKLESVHSSLREQKIYQQYSYLPVWSISFFSLSSWCLLQGFPVGKTRVIRIWCYFSRWSPGLFSNGNWYCSEAKMPESVCRWSSSADLLLERSCERPSGYISDQNLSTYAVF